MPRTSIDSDLRGNAEATRARLLRAAARQVHRNGFRATSLHDILVDTGLTKGAFYHHFANKIALGYALVDEWLGPKVEREWLAPLRESVEPIAVMMQLLGTAAIDAEEVMLGCPLNNLAVELAPVEETLREHIQSVYDRWVGGIAEALERGRRAGTVSPAVDTRDAATFIVAALAGCRAIAKNARSSATLVRCHEHLARYLDTLKP